MSLRIATNIIALASLGDLGRNQSQLADAAIRLAAGSRITKAADDAAGLSISVRLTTQINGSVQAAANVRAAAAMAGIADAALATVHDTLQQMRELVLRAANVGAGSPKSLASIAGEVGALTDLLNAIADFTTAGGHTLLDGSFSAAFQVGPNGENSVILDLSQADMHAHNLGGSEGSGGINVSDLAILGLDGSDGIYTVNGIKADLAALSESIVAVSDKRSDIGAVTNQLNYTVANLDAAITSITASRSSLTDADMAAEAQKFVTARIKSFASASIAAQANSSPEAVLRLLDDSAVAVDSGRPDSRRAGRTGSRRSSGASDSSGPTGGSRTTRTTNDLQARVTVRENRSEPNTDTVRDAAPRSAAASDTPARSPSTVDSGIDSATHAA